MIAENSEDSSFEIISNEEEDSGEKISNNLTLSTSPETSISSSQDSSCTNFQKLEIVGQKGDGEEIHELYRSSYSTLCNENQDKNLNNVMNLSLHGSERKLTSQRSKKFRKKAKKKNKQKYIKFEEEVKLLSDDSFDSKFETEMKINHKNNDDAHNKGNIMNVNAFDIMNTDLHNLTDRKQSSVENYDVHNNAIYALSDEDEKNRDNDLDTKTIKLSIVHSNNLNILKNIPAELLPDENNNGKCELHKKIGNTSMIRQLSNKLKTSSILDNKYMKKICAYNGVMNRLSSDNLKYPPTPISGLNDINLIKINYEKFKLKNLEPVDLNDEVKSKVPLGHQRPQYSTISLSSMAYWHSSEDILRTPLEVAGTSYGFFDWLKGSQYVRNIYRKAKNSLSALLITLDPGMVNFRTKKIKITVIADNEQEGAAIANGFYAGFQNSSELRIKTVKNNFPDIPSQPIGFLSSLMCAERKIKHTRQTQQISSQDILISISPLLMETTIMRWHGGYCVLLDDPTRKLSIHTYSQLTPVPNDYVIKSQILTSEDYPFRHLGLDCTLNKALATCTGTLSHDWLRTIAGISYYTMLENAAVTLAGMYECYTKELIK